MDSTQDRTGAALGTTANIGATEHNEAERVCEKWELHALAARLMPEERVGYCLSRLQPNSPGVPVMYSRAKQHAYFENLMTCGSVWMDPVCSSKISTGRREELQEACTRWGALGGSVALATFTFSHGLWSDLESLVGTCLKAYKQMCGTRAYRAARELYGIRFVVRALEVTWSEGDGWHPHLHLLLFLNPGAPPCEVIEQALYECWEHAAAGCGLSMSREHGVRVDAGRDSAADYVAKFGRDRQVSGWGPADELTRWHQKRGTVKGDGDVHYSPWDLLRWLRDTGEVKPARLFQEYAGVFKGRNQLVWSPGMRQALGMAAESPDEELAVEHERDARLLALISPEEWAAVRKYHLQGKVLLLASQGVAGPVLELVRAALYRLLYS